MEEYYTIEPASDGDGVWAVLHGEYERGSVLEGYPRRQLLKAFDTVEEALKEYPDAEVLDHSTKAPFSEVVLPEVAPDWFDPLDAGEVWHEDDY